MSETVVEKYLQSKQIDYSYSGDQLKLNNCPACGSPDKFYIHSENWLFSCKAGACNWSGNERKLKAHFGDKVGERNYTASDQSKPVLPDVEAAHQALLVNDSVLNYLNDERGISLEVVKQMKLGIADKWFDDEQGEVPCLLYPYYLGKNLVFVKYRTLPPAAKGFRSTGGIENPLYNSNAIKNQMESLLLVEGESDTLALLTAGVDNVAGVPGCDMKKVTWDKLLDRPQKIYLIFDNDEPGQAGAKRFAQRFGVDRFYNVVLPQLELAVPVNGRTYSKDVGEWLQAGGTVDELRELLAEAQRFDVDDVADSVKALAELEKEVEGRGGSSEPEFRYFLESINQRAGGANRGEVTVLLAPAKAGKCLTSDALLSTPDGLKTVEEVFNLAGVSMTAGEETFTPVSFPLINMRGEVEYTSHFTCNGVREVFELRTQMGRTIRSTANHPHLVAGQNGSKQWMQTNLIQPGDYVVTSNHGVFGQKALQHDTAYFIGLLIADGSFEANRIGFTNDDPDIKEFVERVGPKIIGTTPNKYVNNDNGSIQYQFAKKVGVQEFYKEFGLGPCLSKGKKFTHTLRSLDAQSTVELIRGYMDCECSVWEERGGGIEVSSASKALLSTLQHWLWGLGIRSTVAEKKVKAYPQNQYWRLSLSGEDFERYVARVGTRSGVRAAKFARVLKVKRKPNREGVPFCGEIVKSLFSTDTTKGRIKDRLTGDFKKKALTQKLTKATINKILGVEWSNKELVGQLKRLRDEQCGYDKVVSVKSVGFEPTFDVCMPETHSFIANGIVTHNTSAAINQADYLAKQGHSVFFDCYEMKRSALARKWAALVTRTDDTPGKGNMTVAKMREAAEIAKTYPGKIQWGNPQSIRTLEDAIGRIRGAVRRYGCDVVVFDNLQLLVDLTITKFEMGNRVTYMSMVSKRFKQLAQELNVWIILISQPKRIMNSELVGASDTEGSSAPEKDCDSMIILNRFQKAAMRKMDMEKMGAQFTTDENFTPIVNVRVGLSRYAPGGVCNIHFEGCMSWFREITDEENGLKSVMVPDNSEYAVAI